jgi:hypothetical protein
MDVVTNQSPSFSHRKPTVEEKAKCSWCADGWPLTVDGVSRFLHSLPEPGGMIGCLAHGVGYCNRPVTSPGEKCVCGLVSQRHGGCHHWVESIEQEAARKTGGKLYGAPNWPSEPRPSPHSLQGHYLLTSAQSLYALANQDSGRYWAELPAHTQDKILDACWAAVCLFKERGL